MNVSINPRSAAYLSMRLTLGFVFLFYGVGKLQTGMTSFGQGLEKDFASTWLPTRAVYVFGVLLPFLEVMVGVLLVLGFLRFFTLAFAGSLVVILTSGLAISGNPGGVAHNLIYALLIFLLLRHFDDDEICLDRVRRTKFRGRGRAVN